MTTDQRIISGFAHLHGRLMTLWDISPKEPVGMTDAIHDALDELEELQNDVYKALGIEYGVEMKSQ